MHCDQRQRGFSLVELSMVLVIIGLIMGAVSIAVNTQRSAEYINIKQKFVDQWVRAYNDVYMRSGVVPGDSADTPTFAVNAAADPLVLNALLAGLGTNFSTLTQLPARLCEGQSNDPYGGARASDNTSMRTVFTSLGSRMPPGRAEGQEDRYIYLDTNGNPQEVQVCFQWNPPGTLSGAGNVMVIKGLTPDLARMLDEMIDGQVNAVAGMFREQGRIDTLSNHWQFDNTYARTDALGAPSNRDENQVKTVTAHYRMNQ